MRSKGGGGKELNPKRGNSQKEIIIIFACWTRAAAARRGLDDCGHGRRGWGEVEGCEGALFKNLQKKVKEKRTI